MDKRPKLDEATQRIYRTLLERFGEPIGDAPSTPGVPDERKESRMPPSYDEKAPSCPECGKKMTLHDKRSYEAESGTGYPRVCEDCAEDVYESVVRSLGEVLHGGGTAWSNEGEELDEDELDQVAPPGKEKLVKKLKKQKGVKNPWALAWSIHNNQQEGRLRETRDRLSGDEVVTAWEDIYRETGVASVYDLAAWLGTTEDTIKREIAKIDWLTIDHNGDVVEF